MCAAGAPAVSQVPRARSLHDVIYQMRETNDGSIETTAVSSEVSFKKIVFPDGRTEASFERGRDRVSVVSTQSGVTVSRGADTTTIEHSNVSEEKLGRVRSMWATSPALRAFRALVAAIEESDEIAAPEPFAVRLTGALVAQLDGDDGAIARLAGRIRLQVAGPERKASLTTIDCWSIYADAVVRAARDLENCLKYFSIWDPRRNGCSFVWVLQVEGAWFGYLSCSSVPMPK